MTDTETETIKDWSPGVLRDFAHLFCGEHLGGGIGRQVYVLLTDPTKVVKIETQAYSFQNALEWSTWKELSETKLSQYLAPCHFISPCGMALIQSRVQPLPTAAEEKAAGTNVLKDVRLPRFLTDFKRGNYGILDGRVVACDYGTHLAIGYGATRHLRKPDWWE